ncbi:hypothetical protein CR513_32738, partial [Mucuna pruriens]
MIFPPSLISELSIESESRTFSSSSTSVLKPQKLPLLPQNSFLISVPLWYLSQLILLLYVSHECFRQLLQYRQMLYWCLVTAILLLLQSLLLPLGQTSHHPRSLSSQTSGKSFFASNSYCDVCTSLTYVIIYLFTSLLPNLNNSGQCFKFVFGLPKPQECPLLHRIHIVLSEPLLLVYHIGEWQEWAILVGLLPLLDLLTYHYRIEILKDKFDAQNSKTYLVFQSKVPSDSSSSFLAMQVPSDSSSSFLAMQSLHPNADALWILSPLSVLQAGILTFVHFPHLAGNFLKPHECPVLHGTHNVVSAPLLVSYSILKFQSIPSVSEFCISTSISCQSNSMLKIPKLNYLQFLSLTHQRLLRPYQRYVIIAEGKVVILRPNELLNLVASYRFGGRKKLSHIEGGGPPRDDPKFEA